MPTYRTNYGTPDDGNTLGEKEYNEGEDAYHQINQLVRDGYLELVEPCDHFWSAYMIEAGVAERRCNYCDAVEQVGNKTGFLLAAVECQHREVDYQRDTCTDCGAGIGINDA